MVMSSLQTHGRYFKWLEPAPADPTFVVEVRDKIKKNNVKSATYGGAYVRNGEEEGLRSRLKIWAR